MTAYWKPVVSGFEIYQYPQSKASCNFVVQQVLFFALWRTFYSEQKPSAVGLSLQMWWVHRALFGNMIALCDMHALQWRSLISPKGITRYCLPGKDSSICFCFRRSEWGKKASPTYFGKAGPSCIQQLNICSPRRWKSACRQNFQTSNQHTLWRICFSGKLCKSRFGWKAWSNDRKRVQPSEVVSFWNFWKASAFLLGHLQ